ncbi:MAG: carboxypeptidase-like regulatory domain-containing protein [Odoribacter sp.]
MKKRLKTKVFLGLSCTCQKLCSVFTLLSHVTCWFGVTFCQRAAKVITIDFKDMSVMHALYEINRLGGEVLNFRKESVMKETKKITLKRENITVFEAVKACLEGTGLQCSEQSNGRILIGAKEESSLMTLTGSVVDEDGNPLPGVTILLKRTTLGSASDMDGKFVLKIPKLS